VLRSDSPPNSHPLTCLGPHSTTVDHPRPNTPPPHTHTHFTPTQPQFASGSCKHTSQVRASICMGGPGSPLCIHTPRPRPSVRYWRQFLVQAYAADLLADPRQT